MSRAHIKLLQSDNEIITRIVTVLTKNVEKALSNIRPKIENATKTLLRESIVSSDEYAKIAFSPFRYELGLVDAYSNLSEIIDEIVNGVTVKLKKTNFSKNIFVGGFEIKSTTSISKVLKSPAASFETEKGETLPWLEWLLLRGNSIIIADYRFKALAGGRTGGGIMLEGGTWQVDSTVAGTIEDNFITRSIEQMQEPLTEVIRRCLASL